MIGRRTDSGDRRVADTAGRLSESIRFATDSSFHVSEQITILRSTVFSPLPIATFVEKVGEYRLFIPRSHSGSVTQACPAHLPTGTRIDPGEGDALFGKSPPLGTYLPSIGLAF